MSNNLKLEVLLKAVDQATRPFKAIQTASKSLSSDIRTTQQSLRDLNGQASKIDGFRKTSAQLAVTGQSLAKAKQEAAALAVQFKNTESPTRAQARAMELAKKNAADLQLKYNGLRLSVQRQRHELSQAGINTRKLSADELRLKTSISETTSQLNRQRTALARVGTQQAKLSKIKSRYESGQKLAAGARNIGMVGAGMATAGVVAGGAVLRPGFDFSLKNSELQAVLGLDKESADMKALKGQARTLGDNTAASADDAAAAQVIVAKSGADKDGILAQTPAILNMSLANKKTMEENATLLIGTKSAFGLADDKASHIADVISMAMNKTQATFEGLSDSLTYVGPVAKDAGVSLEETAAMLGALHDAKITGSMAGTGGRAVLSRLQAPTGNAYAAIKELGVKTMDSKGNTRPIFTILKEIKASFKRNNLGTGQKAEYMKTIFGEEASSSASVLMAAAASGKLDNLTRLIKDSDGKTAELVEVMQNNLGGDFKEFQSAYEAVGTDLYDQQEESLRKLTQTATKYVLQLDGWIKDHKELAQSFGLIAGGALGLIAAIGGIGLVAWPVVTGINAIIFAAGMLWTVLTAAGTAIVAVLGAITLPVVAVGAVIVGAALLISRYWGEAKAFVIGVGEGFTSVMGPISAAFEPFISILKGIGSGLSIVCDWFIKLISPVSATTKELQTAGNMGKAFGKLLAYGIETAISPLIALQKGIDIVLEKLGIVKKDSSALNTSVTSQPDNQSGGYIPASNPYGGYGSYQPVTAPAGKTYIDQSRPTYQITIPGNGMPGGRLGNDLQDALEKYESKKRADARASMRYD